MTAHLTALIKLQDANAPSAELIPALSTLGSDLADSPSRILAGKSGLVDVLLAVLSTHPGDENLATATLNTLAAALDGQPDHMLPTGIPAGNTPEVEDNPRIESLVRIASSYKDSADATAASLRAILSACIMHEFNRQAFVKHGVVAHLMTALETHVSNREVVLEAARVVRSLILDDDVRVPFGKAHEHAKILVTEGGAVVKLLAALRVHNNALAVTEIITSVGRLAVRNEFCKEIVDAGGLDLIIAAVQSNQTNALVVQAAFTALRLIAGNDDVKAMIERSGGIDLIVSTMQMHLKHADVAEQGCSALAAVCLRSPDNARAIVAAGGANVITKVMVMHPTSEPVQQQACSAIRNVVARVVELREVFLGEGAERLVKEAMQRHVGMTDFAKAALRDLGCEVELKMLWTGTGRNLTYD